MAQLNDEDSEESLIEEIGYLTDSMHLGIARVSAHRIRISVDNIKIVDKVNEDVAQTIHCIDDVTKKEETLEVVHHRLSFNEDEKMSEEDEQNEIGQIEKKYRKKYQKAPNKKWYFVVGGVFIFVGTYGGMRYMFDRSAMGGKLDIFEQEKVVKALSIDDMNNDAVRKLKMHSGAASQPQLRYFVKGEDGMGDFVIDIASDATLLDLKREIRRMIDKAEDREMSWRDIIEVSYQGRPLEPDAGLLADFGVCTECDIVYDIKPLGGIHISEQLKHIRQKRVDLCTKILQAQGQLLKDYKEQLRKVLFEEKALKEEERIQKERELQERKEVELRAAQLQEEQETKAFDEGKKEAFQYGYDSILCRTSTHRTKPTKPVCSYTEAKQRKLYRAWHHGIFSIMADIERGPILNATFFII